MQRKEQTRRMEIAFVSLQHVYIEENSVGFLINK